jgi:hypothetical protein
MKDPQSSNLTLFFKVIPTSIVMVAIAVTIASLLTSRLSASEGISALLGESAMLSVAYLFLGRLKKVSIEGDWLQVSNYFKKVSIPLSSIDSVSQLIGGNGFVTIQLRSASAFGLEITFIPKWRPFTLFSPHPSVTKLRRLIRVRRDEEVVP